MSVLACDRPTQRFVEAETELRLRGGVSTPWVRVPHGTSDDRFARSRQRDEAAVVDLENRAVEVEDRDVVLEDAQVQPARAPSRG